MESSEKAPSFPPVPLRAVPAQGRGRRAGVLLPAAGELRCEMCGAPVIASHCKRICLRCGFMTGCSEGI